jgi:ATP-binding cassette, subfamily C, bacterial
LPQESLFIDGTLRENLIWDSACEQPDEIMNELLKNLNASDFLLKRDITLDTDIHHFKFSFSGGELQRIAIARALLRNPKLLILDEATSALDVTNEDIIFNYLKKISSEITIIIVTHKSRLLKYCDHIITLPADR